MSRQNKTKRRRSPFPSPSASSAPSSSGSEESLTPPPRQSGKLRIVNTSSTTTGRKLGPKPRGPSPDDSSVEDEDNKLDAPLPVSSSTKRSSKRPRSPTEAGEKSERRKSIIAQLVNMDENSLEDLLSSRSRPKGNVVELHDTRELDHSNMGQLQEEGADDALQALLDGKEQEEREEEEYLEDRKALEERAEDLSNALAAPFEQLQKSTIETFNSHIQVLAEAVHTALQPFEGAQTLQQLNVWKSSQTALARDSTSKWDEAEAYMMARKLKMDDLINKIRDAQKEKVALINSAKKELEKAQTHQQGEIDKMREEAVKIKEKYRAKLIKATDKERINKEINMVITQLLAQQMGS
ncbi:hypothetical protein IAU59_000572 [Kwoniella sp. CBS 9459]